MDGQTEAAYRARRRLLFVALALLLVSELLAFGGIGSGAHDVLIKYATQGHRVLSSALLGSAVLFALSDPPRTSRNAALIVGLALEALHAKFLPDVARALANFGGGLGVASLVVASIDLTRAREEERRRRTLRLFEASLFPVYVLVALLPLDLTVLLHPYSVDAPLLALDGSIFGGQPAFAVGRFFAAHDITRVIASAVCVELPVFATLIYVLQRRAGGKNDIQTAFLLAGLVGVVVYHAAPAAGPISYSPMYPQAVPTLDRAFAAPGAAGQLYRSCLPSMSATWTLLICWQARRLGKYVQVATFGLVGATVLATLGLGEHYLVDLVISIPFAVAMRAAFASRVPLRATARWSALAGAAALYGCWLLLVRTPRSVLLDAVFVRPFALASTVAAVVLELRLHRAETATSDAAPSSDRVTAAFPRRGRLIVAIFFASGFAGLLYEVVFAKALALVFGSTAVASTTVLATYMGGIALGSYVGGRIKVRSALRAYGLCELGIGAACALSPVIVGLVRSAYVAIASGGDPGRPAIVAVQVALGALVLLPPTVLMGMTLPILARHFEREDPTLGRSVALLYTANTAGAAAGALLAGYVLLASFGVSTPTLIGVVANVAVALGALRLAARPGGETKAVEAQRDEPIIGSAGGAGWLGFMALGAGGLVSVGLEITYTHLLAAVVGNSTHAFSSMLVSFLVGLAGGAAVGRRWLRAKFSLAVGIGFAQACLVAVVLAGVFAWNEVPAHFASYAEFSYARTFPISELVRFVISACLLLPPALFVGMSYPISIEAIVQTSKSRHERALGNAAAVNTLGNITGALVTGFLFIRFFGSLHTLHALMAITGMIVFAAMAVARGERLRRLLYPSCGVAVVLAALQPSSFDLERLASGSNVYFRTLDRGRVIDSSESAEGGITTVCERQSPDGTTVKTLQTNGKFQGDDSKEMRAQYGFTLLPLLHTTARGPALVIGFGTGTSTRAVQDAGFSEVRAVELSRDIAEMSRRHFSRANGDVLERSNVTISYTDGRNFLLLTDRKYDFIGAEISSIWFAGAASLYNVEFYELTKKRLAEHGVFQQWLQIHHVDSSDLVSMLASIRAVYPQVWLYVAGNQGVAVACASDCPRTEKAILKLQDTPALAEGLSFLGGSAPELAGDLVLSPAATDRLLTSVGAPPSDRDRLMRVASTDDNLFLEYHTPRGNVRAVDKSFEENMAFLSRYAAH